MPAPHASAWERLDRPDASTVDLSHAVHAG